MRKLTARSIIPGAAVVTAAALTAPLYARYRRAVAAAGKRLRSLGSAWLRAAQAPVCLVSG